MVTLYKKYSIHLHDVYYIHDESKSIYTQFVYYIYKSTGTYELQTAENQCFGIGTELTHKRTKSREYNLTSTAILQYELHDEGKHSGVKPVTKKLVTD